MKLTTKGRYAVMAMADLAKSNSNQPISLSEISLRQGISVSFLEQIFLQLKKIMTDQFNNFNQEVLFVMVSMM